VHIFRYFHSEWIKAKWKKKNNIFVIFDTQIIEALFENLRERTSQIWNQKSEREKNAIFFYVDTANFDSIIEGSLDK